MLTIPRDDAILEALRALKAGDLNEVAKQMESLARERSQAKAAMAALEHQARQSALHSKYKSAFLANMSHELRTPLNSLLILAQLLAKNAAGNLTPKQVEHAQTIRVSGHDLLALTDEILDLSKVESGAATLRIGWVSLPDLGNYLEHIFREVARDRGLAFSISMDSALPAAILTDRKRLQQILQNLLANACKFTSAGTVSLQISLTEDGWTRGRNGLDRAERVVAFSVIDSGIGVPYDKQKVIFEAFGKAEGTASRRFEGTGLGLSISSELARLLGGEIRVASTPGDGSTFTLYLPLAGERDNDVIDAQAAGTAADAPDDRHSIRPGDRVVLNVVDDPQYAARLLHQVRALGFKALSARNTHSALVLANQYMPNVVTVGVKGEDLAGWASFTLLKADPVTRSIPMNVICIDAQAETRACMGSLGTVYQSSRDETLREALRKLGRYLQHEPAGVLLAAASKTQRKAMRAAIAQSGRRIVSAATGKRALQVLQRAGTDCAVIGQGLTDMAPLELVREIFLTQRIEPAPLVICTPAGPGSAAKPSEFDGLAEILLLKRLPSTDAVLEEIARCLQEAMRDMPPGQHRPRSGIRQAVPALAGRKALIVDDDRRSAFALRDALERQRMQVLCAESGPDAIALLERNPDIGIILMDMMMPGHDGFQTIRDVHRLERFREVPIIAVTAMAMKGDRDKCIEAGASDYVTKPLDVEQLVSIVGLWLAGQAQPGPTQIRTSPASMA